MTKDLSPDSNQGLPHQYQSNDQIDRADAIPFATRSHSCVTQTGPTVSGFLPWSTKHRVCRRSASRQGLSLQGDNQSFHLAELILVGSLTDRSALTRAEEKKKS